MGTVKTAISLDEPTFRRLDALSRRLKKPRSRLVAGALEQYLARQEAHDLIEQINRATQAGLGEDADVSKRRRRRHRKMVEGTW